MTARTSRRFDAWNHGISVPASGFLARSSSPVAPPRRSRLFVIKWQANSSRQPLFGDKLAAVTPLFNEMNSRQSSPHRPVRVI